MNAQGLNLSGVAPPKTETISAPLKTKQNKKDGNLQGLLSKGFVLAPSVPFCSSISGVS